MECKFFTSSTTPENTRESLRTKAATDLLNICLTLKSC
ncbi:hypothetical protein SFMTTN_2686 [Sulfuriferula multivorans]|uniref:Uncharacterized protein n=1 Tax=Sulfuriferula multivorans TaxID=1559896 RepID=A0A401JGU6_9PROT|nr:hypothetical protein SFMTTN_2686 [Sulfuriferula multivorans]